MTQNPCRGWLCLTTFGQYPYGIQAISYLLYSKYACLMNIALSCILICFCHWLWIVCVHLFIYLFSSASANLDGYTLIYVKVSPDDDDQVCCRNVSKVCTQKCNTWCLRKKMLITSLSNLTYPYKWKSWSSVKVKNGNNNNDSRKK